MKILHLTPALGYDGASRQLALLAAGMPASMPRRVVALGAATPGAADLQGQGVPVDCLDWRRGIDVRPFLRLRNIIQEFRPDAIHVWQPSALRALRLVGTWRIPVVASALLPRGGRPGQASAMDRWLLRGVRVVAAGRAEAEAYRRLGVAAERLVTIAPAVAAVPEAATRARLEEIVGGKLGQARVIVCLGRQDRHKGYSDAIWAFDILRFVIPDIHLVLIGAGPHQERLKDFVHVVGLPGRVHLPGPLADGREILAAADIVWAPSLRSGGINVALEAMAAGRPLVAANLRDLAEIVKDGQAGVLYPVGDKPALARQTKILLENDEQCRWLGAAAQGYARQQFPVASMVERHVALYQSLT